MIVPASIESARSRTLHNFSGGGSGATTDFISSARPVKSGNESVPTPQAYLVEQEPHSALRAHFHMQDQFQVVVAGSGTLGRHPVRAFCVHYARRQTGYGPLTAGPEGLSYFTLRQTADTGAWHLPDFKDKLDPGLTRYQVTSEPVHPSTPQMLKSRPHVSTQCLIDTCADGMGAWCLLVPPDSRVPIATDGGSGRFYIVMAGAMRIGETYLPPLSTVFVSEQEAEFEIQSQSDGLEVIVVQYPRREPR